MKRYISDRHQSLYRMHYADRTIEPRPSVWLPYVEQLATQLQARRIIDYGSGAARGLSQFSSFDVVDYDPGVEGLDDLPMPADLVVSIHAVEHVEEPYLVDVICHMESLALKALLLVISCEPSTKTLPDGSAWHSVVHPPEWWRGALPQYREVPTIKDPSKEFAAIWTPQPWRQP